MSEIKLIKDYLTNTYRPLEINVGDNTLSFHLNEGLLALKCNDSIWRFSDEQDIGSITTTDALGKDSVQLTAVLTDIINLPINYHRNADWIISQYTSGNPHPLIRRATDIVGDISGNDNGELEDDQRIYQYYRTVISTDKLLIARNAARALRVALVQMSTVLNTPGQPRQHPYL